MHKDKCRRTAARPVGAVNGFTLPELLIVITLLVLLISSASSFARWIDESRTETSILNLRSALYDARAEAITRGGRVAICRRDGDLQDCAGIGASGVVDWGHGWMMFWDVDDNRLFEPDEGDLILRVYPSIHPSVKLLWNKGDYVAYNSFGALDSRLGSFCIGPENAADSSQELVVVRGGRVRVSEGDCSYAFSAY